MVLESQFPHKIVNLLFTISFSSKRLTVFVGEMIFKNHLINTLCVINSPRIRNRSFAVRQAAEAPTMVEASITTHLDHIDLLHIWVI